jgi:hypothetical protein
LHHPNASKLESFCLPLKSLHPIAPQNASKIKGSLWHSKACTQFQHQKKCFKAQSSCLALKSLHPIPTLNASKLKAFVWHSKKADTQLHNKMLQNSKLLFGTQKLAPNNWKCFKAPNPSFKLLQNETKSRKKKRKKKDIIKTPPSKHKTQSLSS